jgi:glycosyltransferase involved in cell wall biosynthesis
MSDPALSVLLPVRNGAAFLAAALDSIVRQTFDQWELVAVDDHSTDGTPALLDAYARAEPRIRIVPPEGTGLVPALNTGLAACRAPLVARMDADDISHPCRLRRQIDLLAGAPDVGLVACGFRHFPRQRLRVGMRAYEAWQNGLDTHDLVMRDLFVESPFVHPSVTFRKALVERVGGYRECGWTEDYDLWLRLAAAGVRFARLTETLFFWRDRPDRLTRTDPAYSTEAFRACKVHYLKESFLAGSREVTLVGAGLEGRSWRRVLEAEGIAVSRWIDADPRKQGRILHGAPVLPADTDELSGKLLVTIGTRGARKGLRAWLAERGLVEGVDVVFVT